MVHYRGEYLKYARWYVLDAKTQPNGKIEVMEAPISYHGMRNEYIKWGEGEVLAMLNSTDDVEKEFVRIMAEQTTDTASITYRRF